MKDNTSAAKLDALLKRQAALAAAVRVEREKRKDIDRRNEERLIRIVGRALLSNATQSEDFKKFLIGVLRTTVTESSEQKFLKSQGLYE